MIDIHEMWITLLPTTLPLRILYFVISYFVISFGIAISNRCQMPIIPTDLFSTGICGDHSYSLFAGKDFF